MVLFFSYLVMSSHYSIPLLQIVHEKSPMLAQKLCLTANAGVIGLNSLMVGSPLFLAGAFKVFGKSKYADKAIIKIANHWINTNNTLIDTVLPKKDWRIHISDDLKADGKYLLICNHQSWVDTSIIQYISAGRLPITRFFTKHELLYIPIVGQAFYLLDFPIMKRHSKEAIAKNPALAGQDLDEARRACALLQDKPFVLLNYLEGTRFTTKKHNHQNSPYRHLLKPKAGGFALALQMLGDKIDGILDMTIVYPDGIPQYRDLWQGSISKLVVDIRCAQINDELLDALKQGKYSSDDTIKHQLYTWLDTTWQAKDARIDAMLSDFSSC